MADPLLGEIKLVGFNFAPKGWAFCNGQLLAIGQNQALFSILGTTYGGNGVNTFALPDLRARVPVHVSDVIALGQAGGEAAHTLTIPELPVHTHQASGSSSVANDPTPVGHVWAANTSQPYGTGHDAALSGTALANTGSGQAHLNYQPYLALSFVIALQGIFPTRD